MWGCVGFGSSSWSASNLCSFLPSLLYPQPHLAAPSLELGHLGCSGREQPSYSDCCCDLGWCPSEPLSFRGRSLYLPSSSALHPPGAGAATSGAASSVQGRGFSPPINSSGHSHTCGLQHTHALTSELQGCRG